MVLAEQYGSAWRSWPEAYRRPANADVARFGEQRAERVGFHAWLQWLASRQLEGAAQTIDIVQDLPIGFDAEGADAWCWQDLLADGVSVGAPPDTFNLDGQDWGLPAFVPWKLRQADYVPFIESIRTSMIGGGGLRIDHVMGLFRLWWVPQGSGPADGAYVTQPARDLLDIVALESHRHDAVVIGEDLGTVAPGVREELAARNILSYRCSGSRRSARPSGRRSPWPR
jgi:4-alpha-glucanotransferase